MNSPNKLFNFQPTHLFKAQGIPWRPEVLQGVMDNYIKEDYSIVSCFSEQRLEALFIIKRIHTDVGECVALPCGKFGNIALHKGAIMVQRYWKEKLGYRRIQATVRLNTGYKKEEKWLVRLGFEKEGYLKQYEHGFDHLIFGKVL